MWFYLLILATLSHASLASDILAEAAVSITEQMSDSHLVIALDNAKMMKDVFRILAKEKETPILSVQSALNNGSQRVQVVTDKLSVLQNCWNNSQVHDHFYFLYLLPDNEAVQEIFKQPFVHDFEHLLILTPMKEEKGSVAVFSAWPVCLISVELCFSQTDLWTQRRGLVRNIVTAFPNRFANLSGSVVPVAHADFFVPFSKTYNILNTSTEGSDILFAHYLARAMNFEIEWQRFYDGNWGGWDEEKQEYVGIIGMVHRKTSLLGVGGITKTLSRERAVDFSWPYHFSLLRMVSHVPPPLPKWSAIFWPFELPVWIAVIVSVPPTIIVFFVLTNYATDENFSWGTVAFYVTMPLFHESYHEWPRRTANQVFITAWCLTVFLILSAYSGNLISNLTRPALAKPLDNFADLAYGKNDHQVMWDSRTLTPNIFRTSDDGLFRTIWEKSLNFGPLELSLVPDGDYRRIQRDSNKVFISDENFAYTEISREFTSPRGITFLHVSKEGVYPAGFGFPMPEKAPMQTVLNKWMRMAGYFGLNWKWIEMAMAQSKSMQRLEQQSFEFESYVAGLGDQLEGFQRFTLEHFEGSFYVLFVGTGIGIVLFINEIIFGRN